MSNIKQDEPARPDKIFSGVGNYYPIFGILPEISSKTGMLYKNQIYSHKKNRAGKIPARIINQIIRSYQLLKSLRSSLSSLKDMAFSVVLSALVVCSGFFFLVLVALDNISSRFKVFIHFGVGFAEFIKLNLFFVN